MAGRKHSGAYKCNARCVYSLGESVLFGEPWLGEFSSEFFREFLELSIERGFALFVAVGELASFSTWGTLFSCDLLAGDCIGGLCSSAAAAALSLSLRLKKRDIRSFIAYQPVKPPLVRRSGPYFDFPKKNPCSTRWRQHSQHC